MHFRRVILSASLLLSASLGVVAQSACRQGTAAVSGQVLDGTGAAVVGASVTLAPGDAVSHSDRDGRFTTPCLASGVYRATVEAPSFEPVTRDLEIGAAGRAFTVRLKPLTVQTEVNAVVSDSGVSSEDIAGSRTLQKSEIAQLADDPDEFSRQLQVLAAAAGGAPGAAIVTVDGFQNGGRIPPKSAIAYIRVNPDLFSAEYARPPYRGGRVEI